LILRGGWEDFLNKYFGLDFVENKYFDLEDGEKNIFSLRFTPIHT
jgi:hypothetical protein